MEKIFTAKSFDEAKDMAAAEFKADVLEIQFEIIEQPKKGLFGTKGEFRVRAIYEGDEVVESGAKPATAAKSASTTDSAKKPTTPAQLITDPAELEKFKPITEYIDKVLVQLGVKGYAITVKVVGDNNVIDINGENLGAIIGRRGETLDSLQYLAILANNRGSEENARLRLLVDCNGYREKRTETLEALAVRTSAKVVKQGRRVTLEPMNPYERRIIHSKVAEIDGVFSGSVGDEPYRKVVISAEIAKRRPPSEQRSDRDGGRRNDSRGGRDNRGGGNRRDSGGRRDNRGGGSGRTDRDVIPQRIPGEVSNAVHSKSYKNSSGFATSFEREYKRSLNESEPVDISQDTVDVEKSATLYGKIEL
jgi:spoIIIJ-associated protein